FFLAVIYNIRTSPTSFFYPNAFLFPVMDNFFAFFLQFFFYQCIDICLRMVVKIIFLIDIDKNIIPFEIWAKSSQAFLNWFAVICGNRGVGTFSFVDEFDSLV